MDDTIVRYKDRLSPAMGKELLGEVNPGATFYSYTEGPRPVLLQFRDRDLLAQRDRVLECIVALERLEAQKPRRGRPPNWIASARSVALESGSSPSLPDGAPSGEVPQPVARKRGRPPAKHR